MDKCYLLIVRKPTIGLQLCLTTMSLLSLILMQVACRHYEYSLFYLWYSLLGPTLCLFLLDSYDDVDQYSVNSDQSRRTYTFNLKERL